MDFFNSFNMKLISLQLIVYCHLILVIMASSIKSSLLNTTLIPTQSNLTDARSERLRRLIPYMTYYNPSNAGYNNNENSQQYNFISIGNQKSELRKQPLQGQTEKQPIKYQTNKNAYETSGQHLPNQNTMHLQQQEAKYQTPHHDYEQYWGNSEEKQSPPPQTVKYIVQQQPNNDYLAYTRYQQVLPRQQYLYSTTHQQPTTYEDKAQPEDQKQILTPFNPANKAPGPFQPMYVNRNEHNYPYQIKVAEITQKPEVQEYKSTQRPQYIRYENAQSTAAKYIPQTNYYNSHIPAQNVYPNYVGSEVVSKKPNQLIYPDRVPHQPLVIYNQPARIKNENEYQQQHQQHINKNNYKSVEYVMQQEVPYFQPQTNNAPITKSTFAPINYSPNPNIISTTTITPLYRVTQPVLSTTYRPQNHNAPKYKDVTQRPYYSVTPQPIQHLTETTNHQTPKPYFFQTNTRPISLKNIPKYDPIIKPSPVPKIVIPTKPPQTVSHIPLNSLSDILKKLQESNHLPHTLTPDNIDNSIRTLVKILNDLKKSQKVSEIPTQNHQQSIDSQGDDYYDTDPIKDDTEDDDDDDEANHNENHLQGANTGKAGIDYPALAEIPQTSFNCKDQRYKGFFGDPETNCQVWHYCDLNGGQASFLCPNGTIFSQVALTCDWWFNVKCSSTAQLYVLNERLYKYILPFTPKFPEDYSGPLVDKYLALKFQEMEEKMRKQKKGKEEEAESNETADDDKENTEDEEDNDDDDDEKSEHEEDENVITENTLKYSTVPGNEEIPSLELVSTSLPPLSLPHRQPPPPPKTIVESEKVEVIEIKSDGSSGHLIPGRD